MTYFNVQESMYRQYGGQTEKMLETIIDRYIGEHPKHPPVYRAFNKNGFIRNGNYQYLINVKDKLSTLKEGQFVYAWSKVWADQAEVRRFSVSCYCPTEVYINGKRSFKSNLAHDVFPEDIIGFEAELVKGWNHIVIEYMNVATGCGGRFGTGSIKGVPFHVIVPVAEFEGQEGWVYSKPQSARLTAFPSESDITEEWSHINWLPKAEWTVEEQGMGQLARMFGIKEGKKTVAWTSIMQEDIAESSCTLSGQHNGEIEILIDGQSIYSSARQGEFSLELRLSIGLHHVLIQSICDGSERWGFTLALSECNAKIVSPKIIEGIEEQVLYAGPFSATDTPLAQIAPIPDLSRLLQSEQGQLYWRVDQSDVVIRPYLETRLYGKWNYPLGVTLYGMLAVGQTLNEPHIVDYVKQHIECCTTYDQYALWDRAQYGGAGINHQISAIDSLDDCGSFASTMLELMKSHSLIDGEKVAKRVAQYITHTQDRLADGTLYRVRGSVSFMQDTLWCDDLYMSTPFLCRYAQLTGDSSYLDDAAEQFLLYKKYLWMEEQQYMSHVYDFKFDSQTKIAWGRGNGWVIFSLTELLEVLPQNHEKRDELLQFFNQLARGYLRLQGVNGLWHQVLDLPESYEETSCTSMFIYAFARGIRYGWLAETEAYMTSVQRGWEGIAKRAIDKAGNVYGVCRGSGYSYSALYYKDELTWNLNDTHGIGIVLLAGIEYIKLRDFVKSNPVLRV